MAQEWPEVKPEARPSVRWWWFGNAVDKANLTYNLEQFAAAGIGGVELTPIYGVQGREADEIPFLSTQWMDIFRHTQDEGKRLDIEIDMNTGTGWPIGAPSVGIEDAATKLIVREYRLRGGERLTEQIEPSDKQQRDIARLSRLMAFSEKGEIINLTRKVKDKSLDWTASSGQWRIIALFEGKTLQTVKRAARGGEGYVINHFSARAVDNYMKHFEQAFKTSKTPFPHTLFNDSYEVYGSDWSPGMEEEFAKRRGYRIEDCLPAFLDTAVVNRTDTTARVVSDYRETVAELLMSNFTLKWTGHAHRNGSITRNQAHGSPGNLIDLYAAVDIPECEGFGLSDFNIKGLRRDSLTRTNDSDLSMLKYASSAAHIAGKQYTSSETFTWLTEHFRTSLSQCKPDLDLLFVSGVNHVFLHGAPYSPREAEWPGWLFYASVNMSPTNSIWRDAPAFFEYITRCQSFLQSGRPDNDFLLYLPVYDIWHEQPGRLLQFSIHEMQQRAPKFIKTVNMITGCGYDVDYISDAFVRSSRCIDGMIQTSGGARYKALIVPSVRLMPDDVLQQLLKLAREGADIVFLNNYPEDVPGLSRLTQRRASFRRIAAQLPPFAQTKATPFERGRIITGSDFATVLQQVVQHGDFAATLSLCRGVAEEMKTSYGLQYIRRACEDGYLYFVASLQEKDVDDWITLGVKTAKVALFDPLTGESGQARTRTTRDDRTQVRLQLRSGQSIIIKTYNNEPGDLKQWKYYAEQPYSLSLDHGWTLCFVESVPAIKDTFAIDSPVSWTKLKRLDTTGNCGTALYSLSFKMPSIEADDWILDLGDVRESARVRINNHDCGILWAVPFRLFVGKYLHQGDNRIEVEVTNLPANRIADYDIRGINWRIFKDINMVDINYRKSDYSHWQVMPSGLNSAVRLIPVFR
jgi:hypothetical protein